VLEASSIAESVLNDKPIRANLMSQIDWQTIPKDAVVAGQKFSPPPVLEVGQRYSVYVSQIIDGPKRFYLQAVSGGSSRQLDDLMNRISESYFNLEHAKPYAVPEIFLERGAICVAVSPDNNFSRGCVWDGPFTYNNKPYYSIFWVDYGGSSQVPLHTIHFLKREFAELPMQAIGATMALGWSVVQ
jgi:hypothetical protein